MEQIIFAIDNDNDPHVVAKFMRHCDTERAMGRMWPISMVIGCYNGQLERSYIVLAQEFDKVKDYVKDQESILRVPADTRQPCVLEYLSTGERESVGPMREVSAQEALQAMAWTYEPIEQKYFVCG